MNVSTRIRVDDADGTRVVRFVDRQLFDDRTVREASDQIQLLLTSLEPGGTIVLDFSGVQTISSSMIGKLVLLQRRADSVGARLRMCELNQAISASLRATNLDSLFAIDRDLRESLAAAEGTSR